MTAPAIHRRGFLKSAGFLAVGFAAASRRLAADDGAAGPYPDPDFRQLDSWIVIHENNTATFYVGKTDPGQGTGTGFRQLMSDELDIAFDKTTCVMGSTDITVDQGGSGGSTAMGEIRGRCAAPPPKPAACCWKWRRAVWERRPINSRSATP